MKLKDIADRLGLSVTTVSRALSGNGRVKKETCERVLKLAQESNYTVNSLARSLRLSDTRSIGIVVPDISNSFFASIIKGVQSVCHDHDYALIVCNSDENARYEEDALTTLTEKQVSGLIIASVAASEDVLSGHAGIQIPVIYIDNMPANAQAHDLVSIDNYSAAAELTGLMISRGYREIGMITGPRTQSSALMRLNGFLSAMEKAGGKAEEAWILEGEFSTESGYEEMKRVLSLEKRPEAMLFANNKLAYGAVKAILEAGFRIPEDMAVASFDAYDHTGLVKPQIASLNQPAEEIGRRACEMMIDKLTGGNTENGKHVFLQPFFTEGNSW